MITEKDLQEAIAECQGQRNPNANTCIMLAAFLIIQKEMFGKQESESYFPSIPSYSYAENPLNDKITYESNSEFSQVIYGKDEYEVLSVMDELMEMLKILYPNVYASVMRKL